MYKIVGRCHALRLGKLLCDKSMQVVTAIRANCYGNHVAINSFRNTILAHRCKLLTQYQKLCSRSSSMCMLKNSMQLQFIHLLGCEGSFTSQAHIQPRYFSTEETFDSILKLQASLFKSLSESTVVGYAKDSIIFIHETSGLPWWCSIMVTTVILRTCITLPFTVYQNLILAKVENLTLKMPQIAKQLGMETTYAIKKLNWTEAQAKIAYKRSLKKQWNKLIVQDNCHPFKAAIVLWVQIALWVVYSTAIRNMVYMLPDNNLVARLLNMELSVGGMLWIPNLTVADSSLILPITFGLVNLIIIEVQQMTRVRKTSKFQKYVTNFFRGLTVVMVPIAAGVPSCLCLYWVTSSTTALVQNLVLLSPQVRRVCGIPVTPNELVHPYLHIKKELQRKFSFKKEVNKQ